MEATTVERLLARLSDGDEAAAEWAFRAYEPYLRAVVRRRLPVQVQARLESWDVVQSVWADLLAGLRASRYRFDSAAQLRAFLVRVVQCRLYDRARRALAQTQREQPLDTAPTEPIAREPRPSERVQADHLWERLLALCPAEHQPILHLRRSGLTLDEVAARTGLHEGSVRRILRQLARQLAFAGPPA
jgi:RNA polymerase sigma-70 factor (ECF subfamily)